MRLTKEDLKKSIISTVNDSRGIAATELVAKFVCHIHEYEYECDCENIPELIQELVDGGEIFELEYILPSLDYRIKSMYFPKGTRILNVK